MSTNKDTDTPPLQDASAAFEQALQEKDQDHYLLKLYVSGMTPNSQRAIKNVQKICEEYLQGRFELEIIDIYQQPIFAKDGRSSPSLHWSRNPPPLRKFIGDLSQTERILAGLDLRKKK